jgi:phenylpropionate dioxygenase-like ring-hydroxylating dioxygenase large terminal subunit
MNEPESKKNFMRYASNIDTSDVASSSSTVPAFDWKTEWYPVIPVQDLNMKTPNRITLLGMDFVLWYHEPSDAWRAFADLCPHRLVPLSEGRVESNGVLQCAYHGWEFNEKGACVRIPQLNTDSGQSSAAVNSPRACATSFPICVKQGLVWIFPTPDKKVATTKDLPLIPELDVPDNVDATNFFVRDMPYSWQVLVENLCDPAHVPFAHHAFMGGADRNQESMQLDINVVEETSSGFKAQKDPYPTEGGKYDVKFQAPCLLFYTIVSSNAVGGDDEEASKRKKKKGSFLGLGQYCIPTAPGRSRIIARFPFHLTFKPAMYAIRHTPRWITHLSQNVVMDSDVVFLSSQDELLSRREPNYYMPARCDAMVAAFRKWLAFYGRGGPEWLGIPAKRSLGEPLGWIRPQNIPLRGGRDALLDRYRQHTDVCSSCRGAHKNLYVIREALTYAGIILLAAATASGIAQPTMGGISARQIAAVAGATMLLVPRVVLRPMIARLECVPWPRQKWMRPTPSSKLPSSSRNA